MKRAEKELDVDVATHGQAIDERFSSITSNDVIDTDLLIKHVKLNIVRMMMTLFLITK